RVAGGPICRTDRNTHERNWKRSSLGDHHLEIFAWYDHRAVVRAVHAHDQSVQIISQTDLPLLVKRREGPMNGAVIGLEYIQEVCRRAVAKIEVARFGFNLAGGGSEHRSKTFPRSPQRRRLGGGRGRQILSEYFEQLSYETFCGPVRQADLALWFADPQQLACGTILIGRKHHAKRRKHSVEVAVTEREIFGISFDELDGMTFGFGAGTAAPQ